MNIEEYAVEIPRKENTTKSEEPTVVWPLVEAALDTVDADPSTRDAARAAMEWSDGCVTLVNYLESQSDRVPKMDYRFKVPLIVMATELAEEDDGIASVYDPEEGYILFETDEHDFLFDIYKNWTVDWPEVADEVRKSYLREDPDLENNEVWALDWLMAYLDVPMDDYMVDGDDKL